MRKTKFLLTLLYLLAATWYSGFAATPTVNLKKDFGAIGNGVADDQKAFDKAEAYLQAHPQGAKLIIPAGTYLVGRQNGIKGDDIIHLVKCQNLVIEGAGPKLTHIKFRDGFKFGGFDPATGKPLNYAVGSGSAQEATPGYFLWLEECTGVQVRGLDVNGNNTHLVMGSGVADGGYQVNNDGIMLLDCNTVTLEQLNISYFGRDGLQIKHRRFPTSFVSPPQNFRLRDCAFTYNGRQGMSWTGGRGLTATNCKFSHTGRGGVHSSPGAGVDIEVEDGSKIGDGVFENCEFVDNAGVGVLSDQPEAARDVRNIRFNNCLLWGTSSYSLWVRKTGFSFTNCRLFGTIVHGCAAATNAEATQFTDCEFELRPYKNKPAHGEMLVEAYQTGFKMLFTRCRFRIDAYNQKFYYVNLAGRPASDFIRFKECSFLTRYKTDPTQGSLSYMVGGVFEGNNSFLDSTAIRRKGPAPVRDPTHKLITSSFSPAIVSKGTLKLAAGPDWMHKVENQQTLTIGQDAKDVAELQVASHNELLVYASTVTINENAKLVIKPGGLLRTVSGSTLNVNGTIEVEAGGYLCLDQYTTINKGPKARIVVSPAAIVGTDELRYPGPANRKPNALGQLLPSTGKP